MSATDAAVTELMTERGHEQVVFVADAPSGLRAVIAVHSTALGPSLGGIRFWRYPSERDAVVDVPRREPLLQAMGRAIDELGGRYIAAEDVGATPRDMQVIASETSWVTGIDAPGGSGDPSPMTAYGVLCSMQSVAEELDGDQSLAGKRV